jgi:hypothetical protein
MKFNPITKEVFTDSGHLLKQLNCPLKICWDELIVIVNSESARQCSNCKHPILDTSKFSDDYLLDSMRQNSDTCLRINLNQENLILITNAVLEQK